VQTNHKSLIGLFAAALILRLLALAVFPGHGAISSDAAEYDRLARNLLAGRGFSSSVQAPYEPTMARDPFYPYVLAAFYAIGGGSVTVALVIQAVLSAFTPLLVYAMCHDIAHAAELPARGCRLAGWLTALYPVLVVSSGYVLTEWLATLLLTAGTLLFVRACLSGKVWWAAAAGAALALLALTRAPAQLLPIGLAVLLLIGSLLRRLTHRLAMFPDFGPSLRLAGALLAAFVLVLLPWSLRNHGLFGTYGLTARTGQLWARALNLPTMRYDKPEAVGQMQREIQRRQEQGLTYEEVNRQLQEEALALIRQYPLHYVGQNLREVKRMWITTFSSSFDINLTFSEYLAQRDYPAIAIKLLLIALNFSTLGLWMLGTLARLKQWAAWWPSGAAILYFIGVYSFFWALPRYGILVYPLVLVFVAWGLEALIARIGGVRLSVFSSLLSNRER
jgi:4-amino-4-deoxy-L-arabinose transferase-like glycosyltransferase